MKKIKEQPIKGKESPNKRLGKGGVKPPTGRGLTKVEKLYRFRLVEAALRDGKRGGEVMEYLHDMGRRLTWAQTAEYIADVLYKWEQEDAQLRPMWRERQLRKLHAVAAKLEGPKTWGHWVRLQELIAKIEGNFAPEKIDVTTRVEEFDGWNAEELKKYVNSEGKEIPLRFQSAKGSKANGKDVSGEVGSRGNGTEATLH